MTDYYYQVLELVQTYAGLPIGSLLGLDKNASYYISHALLFFTAAFAFTQLLALFSGTKAKAAGGNKNVAFENLQVASGGKKKKARQNFLIVCGPTNSGKTSLFYHLLTKEVRTTVTSIEINETPGLMEVKIPGEESPKKLNVMDIPGHYHFKERLNEVLDELPRAILVVVDSKEKYSILT